MKNAIRITLVCFGLLAIYTMLFVEDGKGLFQDNELVKEIEAKVDTWAFGDKNPYDHQPKRPDNVPLTNCDGDTIIWDWKYQTAYNDDRLFFHYNEDSCVIMVVMKTD